MPTLEDSHSPEVEKELIRGKSLLRTYVTLDKLWEIWNIVQENGVSLSTLNRSDIKTERENVLDQIIAIEDKTTLLKHLEDSKLNDLASLLRLVPEN